MARRSKIRAVVLEFFICCFVLCAGALSFSKLPPACPADKRSNRAKLKIDLYSQAATTDSPNVARFKTDNAELNKFAVQISRATRNKNWKKAYALFQASPKDTITFNAILVAARNCRKFSLALEIFEQMRNKNIESSPITYTVVLEILGKLDKYEEATSLWKEYKASDVFDRTPKNVLISYTAICSAAARAGDLMTVLSLLTEVEESGVVMPDVTLYGTALDACKTCGDAETARHLLNQMRRRGIARNVVIYTSVIGAHAGSPLTTLKRILAEMRSDTVKMNAYFLESYILSVIGMSFAEKMSDSMRNSIIKKKLRNLDADHIAAIRSALEDAADKNIQSMHKVQLVASELQALRY